MSFQSRRKFIASLAAVPMACGVLSNLESAKTGFKLTRADDDFLEDLTKRACRFFWEQGDPNTGLVLDRVRADGTGVPGRHLEVASTALTGFYLTAMCVAGWSNPDAVGINVGITLMSAENLRTGNIWCWFNRSPDVQRGMQRVFQTWPEL